MVGNIVEGLRRRFEVIERVLANGREGVYKCSIGLKAVKVEGRVECNREQPVLARRKSRRGLIGCQSLGVQSRLDKDRRAPTSLESSSSDSGASLTDLLVF